MLTEQQILDGIRALQRKSQKEVYDLEAGVEDKIAELYASIELKVVELLKGISEQVGHHKDKIASYQRMLDAYNVVVPETDPVEDKEPEEVGAFTPLDDDPENKEGIADPDVSPEDDPASVENVVAEQTIIPEQTTSDSKNPVVQEPVSLNLKNIKFFEASKQEGPKVQRVEVKPISKPYKKKEGNKFKGSKFENGMTAEQVAHNNSILRTDRRFPNDGYSNKSSLEKYAPENPDGL